MADESTRSAEIGGLSLARARAVCPACGVVKNQIDGDRARALQIVQAAVARHFAEAHPGLCASCGHRHAEDGCAGDPTPSDRWAGVSPSSCDCDEPSTPPGSAGRS